MPLKLTVGLAKKVGLPRFGSLGATCHVEIELSGGLLYNDPPAFQRHVRAAYDACRQAVEAELAQQSDKARPNSPPLATTEDVGPPVDRTAMERVIPLVLAIRQWTQSLIEFPTAARTSRSTPTAATAAVCHATQKQHAYIRRLAGQIRGLGVRRIEPICRRMFDKSLGELSSLDASSLIDALKSLKQGDMDVETALQGAAA